MNRQFLIDIASRILSLLEAYSVKGEPRFTVSEEINPVYYKEAFLIEAGCVDVVVSRQM